MPNPLLDIPSIDIPPRCYFESIGRITHTFGSNAYVVAVDHDSYFIKTAGDPAHSDPLRGFDQRVKWLRNAQKIRESFDHPCLPTLYATIESPHGPILVYECVDGHLLGSSKTDPTSPYNRFRSMPVDKILKALDLIYEVHTQLSGLGWVMVDFYDGTVIYDFPSEAIHLIDLDMYHLGPLTNTLGRWWGSSRFMAPEEFVVGAALRRSHLSLHARDGRHRLSVRHDPHTIPVSRVRHAIRCCPYSLSHQPG